MILSQPNRIALAYGVFDGLTQSALHQFRTVTQQGYSLIIGCTSDDLAAKLGHAPLRSYAERALLIENCRLVDRVFEECSLAQKFSDIVNYDASLLILPETRIEPLSSLREIVHVQFLNQGRAA